MRRRHPRNPGFANSGHEPKRINSMGGSVSNQCAPCDRCDAPSGIALYPERRHGASLTRHLATGAQSGDEPADPLPSRHHRGRWEGWNHAARSTSAALRVPSPAQKESRPSRPRSLRPRPRSLRPRFLPERGLSTTGRPSAFFPQGRSSWSTSWSRWLPSSSPRLWSPTSPGVAGRLQKGGNAHEQTTRYHHPRLHRPWIAWARPARNLSGSPLRRLRSARHGQIIHISSRLGGRLRPA
jgi:hypothetical protein